MKKILIAGGAVLLVALAVLATRPQPVVVESSTVVRGPIEVVLAEEGETRVRDRYEVSAPVAGRVLRIELEPGDAVVAGETLLARFLPAQPVPLDARSEAEARAAVETSRAAIGGAEAELEQLRRELRFATTERQRFERLRREGVVSEEDLERVVLGEETAREAVRAAEFAVAATRGELQVARARLTHASATDGGPAEVLDIRSPVSGVVLRRLRESESVVAAGEPLLEVGDRNSLEIISDYLSSDAVRIDPGDPAEVFDWGGEPLRARVRRVEPSGFTKISALGVEEQRVNVILDLEPDQSAVAELGDAFRVEVGVRIWEAEDELRVENGALFRRGEDWAVYAVEGRRAAERVVEIGRRGERWSQVRGGLEPGEVVVLYPPSSLQDGAQVEID